MSEPDTAKAYAFAQARTPPPPFLCTHAFAQARPHPPHTLARPPPHPGTAPPPAPRLYTRALAQARTHARRELPQHAFAQARPCTHAFAQAWGGGQDQVAAAAAWADRRRG